MGLDLDRPGRLHEQVALRPEPFGALAYHFGTRRLAFLKTRTLLAAVEGLGDHATYRESLAAAGVSEEELPAYAQALEALARSGIIIEGTAP